MTRPASPPQTIHHIRNFDPNAGTPFIHPDALKARGRHFLPARVLNALRFGLETATQYALLEGLIADQAKTPAPIPRPEAWAMRFRFLRAVVEEEERFYGLSPAAPPQVTAPAAGFPSREVYREGRTHTPTIQTPPLPQADAVPPPPPAAVPGAGPRSIDAMAARYGADPRQQRYYLSEQRVVVEDEFTPVNPPNNPQLAAQHIQEQRSHSFLANNTKPTRADYAQQVPPRVAPPVAVPTQPGHGFPPLPPLPSLPPLPTIPRHPGR